MTDFSQMTSAELVTAFNSMALELVGVPTVRRFESRHAAIRRCAELELLAELLRRVDRLTSKEYLAEAVYGDLRKVGPVSMVIKGLDADIKKGRVPGYELEKVKHEYVLRPSRR